MSSGVGIVVNKRWGTYEVIAVGFNYKVKRLTIMPGCATSTQMHYHRVEEFTVVRGTVELSIGKFEDQDEYRSITNYEGDSQRIMYGQWHKLRNPGKIPAEIIEIQMGSYLEEDDIVRDPDDPDSLEAKKEDNPICEPPGPCVSVPPAPFPTHAEMVTALRKERFPSTKKFVPSGFPSN